jgi:MerR family transcriptional regulator, thiopeptide resistance regulator
MKVGELARRTGMTVRALHHYDEIGLLEPSERSGSGYRIYSDEDVRRLFRIRALRGLGVPLAEMPAALDGDLRQVIAARLEHVERDLELQRRLRQRLTHALAALDGGGEPSGDDLIDLIEVMTMIESHYTPEQLQELERRRDALGPKGMERAQRDWAHLIQAARAEMEAGTDPGDPRVQELARRWQALVEQFTGGNAGIRSSLDRMYREQGAERASRGAVDADVAAYMGRAMGR